MITTVTTSAGAGAVNIVLPLRLRPGDKLTAAHAVDLTTANQVVAIYLAPARFITITQAAEMPTDTLSECVCLSARTQTSLSDRITWSGDIDIDEWAPVILALFVNCTVSDRVQLAVNTQEKARAK